MLNRNNYDLIIVAWLLLLFPKWSLLYCAFRVTNPICFIDIIVDRNLYSKFRYHPLLGPMGRFVSALTHIGKCEANRKTIPKACYPSFCWRMFLFRIWPMLIESIRWEAALTPAAISMSVWALVGLVCLFLWFKNFHNQTTKIITLSGTNLNLIFLNVISFWYRSC